VATVSFHIPLINQFSSANLIFQARNYSMDILRRGLVKGELLIEDQEGTHHFGTAQSGRAPVVLKVLNDNMWALSVSHTTLSHDIGCQ
jgi:hypothetical protein